RRATASSTTERRGSTSATPSASRIPRRRGASPRSAATSSSHRVTELIRATSPGSTSGRDPLRYSRRIVHKPVVTPLHYGSGPVLRQREPPAGLHCSSTSECRVPACVLQAGTRHSSLQRTAVRLTVAGHGVTGAAGAFSPVRRGACGPCTGTRSHPVRSARGLLPV